MGRVRRSLAPKLLNLRWNPFGGTLRLTTRVPSACEVSASQGESTKEVSSSARTTSALSLWPSTKCHSSALHGRSEKPVDGRCPRCGRSLRCSCPPLGRQQLRRVSTGDGCLLAP